MEKTRDLSLYNFFSKLQEEYVCAEIRKKIYTKPKDKKYWQRVMDGKAIKIKDIALRNCLQSIFNNESCKEKIYNKIINKQGIPNFVYKDEYERQSIEGNDLFNYYKIGSEFKLDEFGLEICILIQCNLETMNGLVRLKDNSETTYKLRDLTRIL